MNPVKCDPDLQKQMASLDIMEVDNTENLKEGDNTLSQCPARVLRKRKSVVIEDVKSSNRRVSMKPRKRQVSERANPKQIESLYLNKQSIKTSQTLETIYEEPKNDEKDSVTLIGGRKVKRLLTFPIGKEYTKEKIKKRRSKIKKLLGNKSFLNRKKIPMGVFLKTIEMSEPE